MTGARSREARALAAVLLALTGALAAQQAAPQLPQPTFDTKAELVLVDVTVVDRDGNPISTLTADDFELQVNGQPRPLQSLQFISTVPDRAAPASPRQAAYSSNESPTTGRLMLFVVDEGHIRAGSSRTVLRAARTLMDRLAPGDLVGLARLPTGVGNVEFTADRSRVAAALGRVGGTSGGRTGMSRLRISEAWALESHDTTLWEQAVERECAGEVGPGGEACASALEADARGMLSEASARAQSTLRGLESLLLHLVALKTPINLVMISEGLFVARDRTNMNELARRAAEARATIHIIRPSQSYFDMEDQVSPGLSRFFDDGLLGEGLEQLAGQTRGTMTTVGGSAAGAFDRLGRELSGYYLIGFEPTDADRTGRERRIRVQVKTRGLTVRARPTFVIRNDARAAATGRDAGAPAPVTPVDQVKFALGAPLPTRGLPVRVATFTAADAASAQVRVVITAEVGDPATEPAEWPIGVMLIDKNDKPVMTRAGQATLAPASSHGPSPRLLLTSVLVEPGEYTLRVAAADDAGRVGSAHHTVIARLVPAAGTLNVSDLLLAAQPAAPGDLLRPRPSMVIDSDTVSATIEMTSADPRWLGRARVTVEVAEQATSAALVSADARQASRGGGQRAFAATLKLGLLPPGEYHARAIVSVPGEPEWRAVRAFLLSPPAAASAIDLSAPLDPDAPPVPAAPPKIIVLAPRFVPESVLGPAVLVPFLDGLAALHPPSAPVEAAMGQIRGGTFAVPDAPGATPDDEVVLTFLRGLDAYQKGDTARAAAWFEQTLKGDSGFLGAAFYLGACHAASGRDKEAVGAWQMALLSENPGAVYPALVDALLRMGDPRLAAEFLLEAPSAWADDNQRLRREAMADAMLGDFRSALPKLVDLIGARKSDQNLLFMAIQVLYRLHLEPDGLSPAHKALFAEYVDHHQKMGGPNKAIVETWRRYVLKP